ncbi:MAG: NADPH-dependent F420 reductase [bacterium]
MRIALIGGTGRLGTGLARRLAAADYDVLIGSREPARATAVATTLNAPRVSGTSNDRAARAGEIIILTVPYAAHRASVVALAGSSADKIVVDPTVPLLSIRPVELAVPDEGSAAARTQAMLPQSRVVSALHTISADLLADVDHPLRGDTLLCGNDAAARDAVAALIRAIGLVPVDAGPLTWAQTLEQLGALMIQINQRYRVKHAGLHITGLRDKGITG